MNRGDRFPLPLYAAVQESLQITKVDAPQQRIGAAQLIFGVTG
jgi:hypothetical protein